MINLVNKKLTEVFENRTKNDSLQNVNQENIDEIKSSCKQYNFDTKGFDQCQIFNLSTFNNTIEQKILNNRHARVTSQKDFDEFGYSFDSAVLDEINEVNLVYANENSSYVYNPNLSDGLNKALFMKTKINELFLERDKKISSNLIYDVRPKLMILDKNILQIQYQLKNINLRDQQDVKILVELIEKIQIEKNKLKTEPLSAIQIIFQIELPNIFDLLYIYNFGDFIKNLGYKRTNSSRECSNYLIQFVKTLKLKTSFENINNNLNENELPYVMYDLSCDVDYTRELIEKTKTIIIKHTVKEYVKVAIMSLNLNNTIIGGGLVFIDQFGNAYGERLVVHKDLNPGVGNWYMQIAENLLRDALNVSKFYFRTYTAEGFHKKLGYITCPFLELKYQFSDQWQNHAIMFKNLARNTTNN